MVSAQIGGYDDEDARYTTSANERLDEGHELQGLAQAWLVREQSPAPANGAKKPPDAVGLVGHQHLRTVHGSARVIQLREVARAGKRGMWLDTRQWAKCMCTCTSAGHMRARCVPSINMTPGPEAETSESAPRAADPEPA